MCVTSLRLPVTPSMVPLGRLLVFHVRESGEGVADSLQFAVETFFENQVERRAPNRGHGRKPLGFSRVSARWRGGLSRLTLRLHVASQARLARAAPPLGIPGA